MVSIEQLRVRRTLEQLRRARVPRRRRPLPRQRPADSVATAYFGSIRVVLKAARAVMEAKLFPALPALLEQARAERTDAADDTAAGRARRLIEVVVTEFGKSLPTASIENVASAIGRRTSDWQKEQLKRQLKAGLGVEVDPPEPFLRRRIEAFATENARLITSVPEQYLTQVGDRVLAGVRAGVRFEVLADELQERFGVAESRANLIARDQVGKFYGELNELRQKSLGIDGYIWRTSNDNRVRSEHEGREGKRFLWSEPPADGHPGEAINCRCNAEPNLSGILEGARRRASAGAS